MFKVNNKDTRTTPSSVSFVNSEQVNAGWEANKIRVIYFTRIESVFCPETFIFCFKRLRSLRLYGIHFDLCDIVKRNRLFEIVYIFTKAATQRRY